MSQMVADLHVLEAQVGIQLGHGGRKSIDAKDPIALVQLLIAQITKSLEK